MGLTALAGDGQFELEPLIPTVGVNMHLPEALLAKVKSAPVTLSAIGVFAVDDNRIRAIQLGLESWQTIFEFFQGQAHGALNVAKIKIRKGTDVEKDGRWFSPQFFRLCDRQQRNVGAGKNLRGGRRCH